MLVSVLLHWQTLGQQVQAPVSHLHNFLQHAVCVCVLYASHAMRVFFVQHPSMGLTAARFWICITMSKHLMQQPSTVAPHDSCRCCRRRWCCCCAARARALRATLPARALPPRRARPRGPPPPPAARQRPRWSRTRLPLRMRRMRCARLPHVHLLHAGSRSCVRWCRCQYWIFTNHMHVLHADCPACAQVRMDVLLTAAQAQTWQALSSDVNEGCPDRCSPPLKCFVCSCMGSQLNRLHALARGPCKLPIGDASDDTAQMG